MADETTEQDNDGLVLTDEDNETVFADVSVEAADTDNRVRGVVLDAKVDEDEGRLRFEEGTLKIPLASQTSDGRETTDGFLRKAQIQGYGGMVGGMWQDIGIQLDNGVLTFPYIPRGVYSEPLGRGVTWQELKSMGIVRLHDGEAGRLGMSASIVGDFLTFYVDRI